MEVVKKNVKKVVDKIWYLIFKEKTPKRVYEFIRNLGFITVSLFISKIFSMILQIYAGRILGPYEYGKFALVLSLSSILYPIFTLGISNALVRYLAKERNVNYIATSLFFISISTVFISTIFFIFSNKIADIFNLNNKYIFGALLLSIFNVLFIISQNVPRGLFYMKKVGDVFIIQSFSSLTFGLILIRIYTSAKFLIFAYIVGYFISFLYILPVIVKNFGRFDSGIAKKLLSYGRYALFIGMFLSIQRSIDKLLINRFIDTQNVGIYQAYAFSTLGVMSFIMTVVQTVFFPEASRSNKKKILKVIDRIILLTPLYIFIVFISGYILLKLYGKDYSFNPYLMLLFSFAAVSGAFASLLAATSASYGIYGVRLYFYSLTVSAALNVILNIYLIRLLGLFGAVLSTLFSNLCLYTLVRIMIKRVKEE